MATITEDYVSFETAKMLKEKGFDEECKRRYNCRGELSRVDSMVYMNSHRDMQDKYVAPTLQMAMKWLREVYGLHISLEPCYDYDSMHVVFLAFVQNVADVHEFFDGRKNVASYPNAEKSYELAIKYCLENLI